MWQISLSTRGEYIKNIDDTKILELYHQGKLHREIAEELGYGVSTVTRHLLSMGIKTYRLDKHEVEQLHLYGLSDYEIAELMGCTRSTVTICLNKMGYKNRQSKIENIDLRNRISQSLIGRFVGDKNPNYKGHSDIKQVARGIFKTISRQMIRNCDYTCDNCGVRGGELETHHIKPFSLIITEFILNVYDGDINTIYSQLMNYRDFTDTSNMVVLCHDCHQRTHYTDDHELSPYRWESATTIESTQKSCGSE